VINKNVSKRTVKAAVFAFSTPSARAEIGKAEQKPNEAKIVQWGERDDLPHHYLRLIGSSGTATSCLQLLETFINADGFRDENAAKCQVNETQTADSLLQDITGDIASLNGLALRVRFIEGKVQVENLPLECVRKLSSGQFIFNPTFGQKKINKELDEILTGYSTLEALKEAYIENPEEVSETGQLYYYYYKTKGAYDYPKPPYATVGGLADIENDTEISLYDLDEVKSGFRLNAIMTAIGNYEDILDENGEAIENPDLANLKANLKSFTERTSAIEARKKIMLLTAETQELVPKLEPFNNSKSLELMDAVTLRIANKVCRHMVTPPVLVGIATAGQLGQTQEIVNMIQLFQMRIVKYQSIIQRVMEELFPEISDWMISTLNPLKFIPAEVIAKMTDEEIRAIGGLPAIENVFPVEIQKTLTALNALTPLVANKVLESMTESEIRALIGLNPKIETNGIINQ
jgi:hypothetical protein